MAARYKITWKIKGSAGTVDAPNKTPVCATSLADALKQVSNAVPDDSLVEFVGVTKREDA